MPSEKLELLGKGLYANIPDTITVSSIPTSSELDYVSSEDFESTMLDTIFPKAIEEKCNWRELLEVDFYWICRCMRILNYGPYYTTNAIFCSNCGRTTGEYSVDLRSIECKPINISGVNEITISKDEFIEFSSDVKIKLLTIQEKLNSEKDPAFMLSNGKRNRQLAKICYSVTSIKGKTNLTPLEVKLIIEKDMSASDYLILKECFEEATNFGLRAGGSTTCPKCGNKDAAFISLVDDRFLRPTMGDLRRWKADVRSKRNN